MTRETKTSDHEDHVGVARKTKSNVQQVSSRYRHRWQVETGSAPRQLHHDLRRDWGVSLCDHCQTINPTGLLHGGLESQCTSEPQSSQADAVLTNFTRARAGQVICVRDCTRRKKPEQRQRRWVGPPTHGAVRSDQCPQIVLSKNTRQPVRERAATSHVPPTTSATSSAQTMPGRRTSWACRRQMRMSASMHLRFLSHLLQHHIEEVLHGDHGRVRKNTGIPQIATAPPTEWLTTFSHHILQSNSR